MDWQRPGRDHAYKRMNTDPLRMHLCWVIVHVKYLRVSGVVSSKTLAPKGAPASRLLRFTSDE